MTLPWVVLPFDRSRQRPPPFTSSLPLTVHFWAAEPLHVSRSMKPWLMLLSAVRHLPFTCTSVPLVLEKVWPAEPLHVLISSVPALVSAHLPPSPTIST